MHETERREPAAELCYGDLNGGRDFKYVYALEARGNRRADPRTRLMPLQNDSLRDAAKPLPRTNPVGQANRRCPRRLSGISHR